MKKNLPHFNCRLILFAALSFAFAYSPAIAQTLQTNLPITNGNVNAVLYDPSGDLIYIGGEFTNVGPNTGRGVGIDGSTGNTVSGFPYVNGTINAVVPDGSGGWYIGGSFTSVGGIVRNNIAHINADKSVDNGWNPNVNGNVFAIAVSGVKVYVGGGFSSIGGQARNYIAALDASTGNATEWNPNSNSEVYALAISELTVYVGGNFSTGYSSPTIGGQTRNFIAAINAETGLATSWDPNADNDVKALVVSGTTVFACGSFTSIGGQARNRIAALDATANTNNATSWDPNSDGDILALALSGSTVFVGGSFSNIGGQVRNYIAALDATTNTNNATSWNPNASNPVSAIAISGSTVYVGGSFTTLAGGTVAKNYIAAINADGTITSWNPNADNDVSALAVSGTTVYAGGDFNSVGGQARNNIAVINASTGSVQSWNPNANSVVKTLAMSGSIVYAGGSFSNIGGQARNRIAALDATTNTNNATSWNPNANSTIYALAISADGNTVYVGGDFNVDWYGSPTIGGQDRNCIAAIDASTGNATSWNPNANGAVYALALSSDGSTVYAGGDFNVDWYGSPTIGGADRNCIAAIDASTGSATSWDPNANNIVYSLVLSGSTVYVGGSFTTLAGGTVAKNYIAAINVDGTITSWNPNANGGVYALAVSGSTIYAGGTFSNIGVQTRNRIAAIDASTGTATSWNPNASGQINAIALSVSNMKVYTGGYFSSICGTPTYNFAGMDNPGDAALPVELTSFTANIADGKVTLNWQTATEVDNYGFEVERTVGSPQSSVGSQSQNTWEKIGFVEGHGNSNSSNQYSFKDNSVVNGKYSYRLKQIDNDGKYSYSAEINVKVENIPTEFVLYQNYPNPFNPTTTIKFQLPHNSRITIKIFDVLGREIETLIDKDMTAGNYEENFDAGKLSSGMYLYRLTAGSIDGTPYGFSSVKKCLLIK